MKWFAFCAGLECQHQGKIVYHRNAPIAARKPSSKPSSVRMNQAVAIRLIVRRDASDERRHSISDLR